MFGMHRRWKYRQWREDQEREQREHGGRHHEHGDPREEREERFHRHGPPGGPHFGRWDRPSDGPHWFGPGRRGPFGPPWGRGGPFGDDPPGMEGGGRRRHRRGDIKYVLMELLAEQPRHGYELIKELENRYGGFYRPSPGSVYPTLQLLEDEGYLTSEVVEGKRVYSLTDAGRQLLDERKRTETPEDRPGRRGGRMGLDRADLQELREVSTAFLEGVMQAARHGSAEQVRAVIALLTTTRRELYRILAQEDTERPTD